MADETVNIIFNAVNNADAALNDLKAQMAGLVTGADKLTASQKLLTDKTDAASKALTGIRGTVLSVNQALQLATQVYNQVSRAIDQTLGEYVRYSDEMEKIHRLTGIQIEDASRLVQAADDVFVSQESFTSGMQFAIRQGYQPSVEWIKKMADTLMAMEDPTARAREAIRIFGRQAGPELLKFMELGSEGIDKYMNSVNAGLIVTEESRQKTIDYKEALDDLNDAWVGFKQGIIGQLIQPLTAYLQLIMIAPDMIEHSFKAMALAIGGNFEAFNKEMILLGEHGSAFATTVMDMVYGTNQFTDSVDGAIPTLEELNASVGYFDSAKGVFDALSNSLGIMDPKVQALGLAFGYLTQQEIDMMVATHNFDVALQAWGNKPITKKIVIDMWFNAMGDIAVSQGWSDRGSYLQNQANAMLGGGGGGKMTLAPWATAADRAYAAAHPELYKARGGYVSGRYAITGDSMSGRRTGYEELVDFQQKKVYSAPQTRAMGAVPGYAMGSGAIDLSYQTIQDLANAVAQKMSGYV